MKHSNRVISGIIIWWTEGTKTYRDKRWKDAWIYPIEVTNTNPDILRIFLSFLRNDIRIDEPRLKLQLQVHEGDDKEKLEKYWSKITRIPLERFNKTIIRPKGNKVGKSNGTCKVRYTSKETYIRMKKLLDDVLLSIDLK